MKINENFVLKSMGCKSNQFEGQIVSERLRESNFVEVKDLKDADFYADMMLKINPKSPSAYFIKAKIAQINGDNDKAVEFINKAIIIITDMLEDVMFPISFIRDLNFSIS